MAKYRITAPDGGQWEVTAPDDATEAQVLDYARSQWAAQAGIDKRRLEPNDRLNVLRAQLSDPNRNLTFDSELRDEIARLERKAGAEPVAEPPQPTLAAPAASQGDVRRAEPRMTPLQEQELQERLFDEARRRRLKEKGGFVIPSREQERADVSQSSGIRDPEETRSQALAQHLVETGEFVEDNPVALDAAKMLAEIGGFAIGGPAGATAIGMAGRYTALKRQLDEAIKAGLDPDEADTIFAEQLAKGTTVDAAFNFGLPVLGRWVAAISGKAKLGQKFHAALTKVFGEPSLRDAKIAKRAAQAATPERKQAVTELSKRVGDDFIPTPGQVTGEASVAESQARKASPRVFARQEDAISGAAEKMRQEAFYPGGQPSRSMLGERIVQIADETVKATKDRLRPVFQAADNLGVQIDMRGVAARAEAALKADAAVPGGKLVAKERTDLEALVQAIRNPQQGAAIIPGINPSGRVSAEATLDFISRQKEKLRSTTADWKPSEFYDTILNGLMKEANTAYEQAARAAGKGRVLDDLLRARNEYRTMIETVFDDAMKQALRKEGGGSPETIGQYLWQQGNVSRLGQLNDLLGLAQKEGKLTTSRAQKMQRDVTRGFLQEAIPNVEALANWSRSLAERPRLKETWDVLTSTPGGKQLAETMKVLEEAAKIATTDTTRLTGAPLVLNPAAAESFARRGLSGAQKPHFLVGALSYTGLTRAAATAYTHGEKGVFNWITKIARLHNVNTAAATKAVQEASEQLQAWAERRGVDLSGGEAEEQE